MKANAAQIAKALARPSADIRLYLLHGPDEASALDLARQLGSAMGKGAERVDLDGATLKNDPARLADEAASLSLFGDKRYIRVTEVGDESVDALAALLSAERAGNPAVVIAPNVKASAKIVKLAIDSRMAMTFACYLATGADADRIATGIARDHGLRIAHAVAHRLVEATGGDRAVLTREIEKLALYLDADADHPAELDDAALDAVGADRGDADTTGAIDALVEGRSADLGAELIRLGDAGTSPIPWLRQLQRRLIQLAEMRASVDRGEPVEGVMKRNRVFFREEAATARVLRRWNPTMLMRALDRVREAERAVMAPHNAGTVLAETIVTEMAQAIKRRG